VGTSIILVLFRGILLLAALALIALVQQLTPPIAPLLSIKVPTKIKDDL
jgi:hypothetical protein